MISIEKIKELRNKTLAGMMACKEALTEADGDMDKAIDIVKARGLANVANRAAAVGTEGRVYVEELPNKLFLVEVNCQTDFVANSDGFGKFVKTVAENASCHIIENAGFDGDFSQIKSDLVDPNAISLEDLRKEQCAATGENIVIRRWKMQEATKYNEHVIYYIHSNNKIATALTYHLNKELNDNTKALVSALMSNIAMQIAAMNPIALSRSDISSEDIARQKGVFETQLKEANKPEAAWAKITEGKFNKWYSENCLLEQEAVFASKKTIQDLIAELANEIGWQTNIISFSRLEVGQGLEKKQENLAEAVALAIN